MDTISVKTNSKTQFVNITGKIAECVRKIGITEGLCNIFVPHTTAGVTINENADPSVVHDILTEINKIVPFQDNYHHMEGNSAAHIKSSLFSPSLIVPVSGGSLILGTWQSIYFCEFDGPRSRKVHIQVK